MSWGAVAVAGATIVGGAISSRGSRDAADAQSRASREGIDEQRQARESFERRTEPFRQVGLSAALPILNLLGIAPPDNLLINDTDTLNPTDDRVLLEGRIRNIDREIEEFESERTQRRGGRGFTSSSARQARSERRNALTSERQELQTQLDALIAAQEAQQEIQDVSQPTQGQLVPSGTDPLLSQINPLVSFLRDEGFEDIQEAAAAQGRLRSGGTLEDLTRFNTQLASTVVPQLQQQRFNQLFNLLGLGSNVATGQGTAGLQTAGNIAGLQQSIGAAQAAGSIGQANALSGTIGDLAGIFGAQQAGLFNRQTPNTGLFDTGTRVDPATGAVQSPAINPSTGAIIPATPRFGGF